MLKLDSGDSGVDLVPELLWLEHSLDFSGGSMIPSKLLSDYKPLVDSKKIEHLYIYIHKYAYTYLCPSIHVYIHTNIYIIYAYICIYNIYYFPTKRQMT